LRRVLAWGVHVFTACGAVLGAWALLAVDAGRWRTSLLLLFAALIVDSADGALARAAGVSRVLPHFDGRRLDDIVDYLNYVVVPTVFLVAAGYLPHWGWAAAPILASAYGFGHGDAKTADDFFLGFPSYWNVVAFYAWALDVPPWFCTAAVLLLSVGVFVPFKYVYPSRLRRLRGTTLAIGAVASAVAVGLLLDPERGRSLHLAWVSTIFPIWYLGLSLWLGGLHRRPPPPA
jgi:phosphatidylcholine synthase